MPTISEIKWEQERWIIPCCLIILAFIYLCEKGVIPLTGLYRDTIAIVAFILTIVVFRYPTGDVIY